MNSDKRKSSGGNALIYILLALALLGGLTMIIANQNTSASSEDLSSENAELLATSTVAFAASAKNAVDQMMFGGTPLATLDFKRPGETGYNSGVHRNQVFHPEGGGISLDSVDKTLFVSDDTNPKPGWYMGHFNNIEWTPTTANDVLLVAYGISLPVCQKINKKITGTNAVPVVGDDLEQIFIDGSYTGGATEDLTKVLCPDCDGYPSMCVTDNHEYVYYNIISGQ